MPNWFVNDGIATAMYPNDANGQCVAECMRVLASNLQQNFISIIYTDMTENCFTEEITITCKQFRNPISQKLWYGFNVALYDNEANRGMIEQSNSAALDTTLYRPANIPSNQFTI